MSTFPNLQAFVLAYKNHLQEKEEVFDQTITGTIKKVQKALLSEEFLPSMPLKKLFLKLLRRSLYPMEVAISGQFSSGKSTFLNALLQKDILPTGITPVTSKVNFINYGKKYRLKVTYLSGKNEFYPIKEISKFTDQRKRTEDIKYITLYAPMDILKDISFVDTPGLNSLSNDDTTVTQKILKDVDAIIWLTLIDNAGKESEAQILRSFLSQFQDKSLCVLNQKDKFSKEQIQTTCEYVEKNFSNYFAKVIPISAQEALQSRQHQKEMLKKEKIEELAKSFKQQLSKHLNDNNLEFFNDTFNNFKIEIEDITNRDSSLDLQMQKDSNILKVINFIEDDIRPKALQSKVYSINRELISICNILKKENQTILAVYESLDEIHQNSVIQMKMELDSILQQYNSEFFLVQEAVNSILIDIAHEIFINIKPINKKRYKESKSIFSKRPKIDLVEYESVMIDYDNIMKNLFYDDQTIDKRVTKITKLLQRIEDDTTLSLRDVFLITKTIITKWQRTYEHLDKQREIASDLEFANMRNFVARVYENFLSFYHGSSEDSIAIMRKNLAFLKGAFCFNYQQITKASILFFNIKLTQSINSYERDPTQFAISTPGEDEILEKLKNDFSIQKLENFLTSNRSYMHNIINYSKNELNFIGQDRTKFLKKEIKKIKIKIKSIQEIKNSIN